MLDDRDLNQRAGSAQQARGGIEEVVVTARRREESIQDVPMSVLIFSQRELDQKGIKGVNDLSSIAPGLSVQNTSNNRRRPTFSIRGQGQVFGQNSPGVVAYFAEVPDPYLGSASSSSLYFYDLENVQVLKGPQGTLFGRNTSGGAILFTPRKPAETWNGNIVTRFGNYDQHDYEFAVGGALIPDTLLFRVAGQMQNRDGYTREVSSGVLLDDLDRRSFRASVVWTPFDNLENYTIFSYEKVDENGTGSVLTDAVATVATLGLLPGFPVLYPRVQQALQQQDRLGARRVVYDWPTDSDARMDGFINITTWAVSDHLTIKNIYSDRDFDAGRSHDTDATPVPLLGVLNPYAREPRQRTEELQLQVHWRGIEAVLGYYYEEAEKPVSLAFLTTQFATLGAVAYGGTALESEAFFTQLDYQLTDDLAVSAGVRYTEDDTRTIAPGTQTYLLGIQPVPPLPNVLPAPLSSSSTATTWNIAVNYALTDNVNTYATVRKGYKSGGSNGAALLPAQRTFDPEYVTDYEVGLKALLQVGGWQIRTNVDIYLNEYTDIQRFINLPTIPASTITDNAAAGEVSGIDLDLGVSPSDWFQLAIGYAYVDARYDEFVDPLLGDLTASNFPNTPRHQFTVAPELRIPIPEGAGQLTLSANYYYQSETFTDAANVENGNPEVALTARGARVPSYEKLDVRLDWQAMLGTRLSLAAYARNVTDEEYVLTRSNSLSSLFGTVISMYGEPRTYGIEVRYDFGQL